MPSNRNKRTRNTTEHVDVEVIENAAKKNNKLYNKLYPNQAPRALTGTKAKKAKKAEARQQISTKRSEKARRNLAAKKKEQVALAVKHCLENNMTANQIGPKHYPNKYKPGGQWEFVKNSTLHDRLQAAKLAQSTAAGEIKTGDGYASRRILTDAEIESLVTWCLQAEAANFPQDRRQIRIQIRKMLVLRRKMTLKRINGHPNPNYRAAAAPLSTTAEAVLSSQGALPSNEWFRHQFYDKHPQLSEKRECVDDAVRMAATTVKKARHHLDVAKLESCNLPIAHTIKVPVQDVRKFCDGLELSDENVLRGKKESVTRCRVIGCKPYATAGRLLRAHKDMPEPTALRYDTFWLACVGDIKIYKESHMAAAFKNLPTEGDVLITLNSRCADWQAIYDPVVGKFQSGDRDFMKRVQQENDKLQCLQSLQQQQLDQARQIQGHTSTQEFIAQQELLHG